MPHSDLPSSTECLLDEFYVLPNANNSASNDPTNANRGNCATGYQNGAYDSKVIWTRIQIDYTTLRVNATDHTFATLEAGSTMLQYGQATDCAGHYSELGKAVIDLRGTPFAVDGVSSCSCTGAAGGSCVCGQWTSSGWYNAMTLQCTDNNQYCTVRCGGYGGNCKLTTGYLQLALFDEGWFNHMCAGTSTSDGFRCIAVLLK